MKIFNKLFGKNTIDVSYKKELKEKIKKATEEILWEEKKKRELLEKEIDYDFLQTLLNKCDNNPDLTINIYLRNGERIVLHTKHKVNNNGGFDYDGEPAVNEMDIK